MAKRKTKAQLQEELNMWKETTCIFLEKGTFPDNLTFEEAKLLATLKFNYVKMKALLLSIESHRNQLHMYNLRVYIKRKITEYIKSVDGIKDSTPIEEYMKVFNKLKYE